MVIRGMKIGMVIQYSYNYNGNNTDIHFNLTAEQTQSWTAIAEIIAEGQQHNICHDAAEVAKGTMPFQDEDQLNLFTTMFQAALDSPSHSAGFGLDEEYELSESYKTGHSKRPLVILLPYSIWFPQMVTWCKALDLLKYLSVIPGI